MTFNESELLRMILAIIKERRADKKSKWDITYERSEYGLKILIKEV